MGWTGDPVWLAEVLRAAGLRVIEHAGWRGRGHGDFRDIRGIVCHHTAGGGTNDWTIVQNGRSDLPGPLAQLVLERDGTYRVIAAGVCWHAGRGRWPGWPTDNANWHTIGIEAVNDGRGQPWPAVQLDAYKRGCAAIARKVGFGVNNVVGHKEYSSEGKIDPFPINMAAFRADVARILKGDDMTPEQERKLDAVLAQLGPWPQLGKNAKGEDLTLVDAVAGIARQLGPWPQLGTDDQGRPLTLVDAIAELRGDVDHLLASNRPTTPPAS